MAPPSLEPMTSASIGELQEFAGEFEEAGESGFQLAVADPEAFLKSVEMFEVGDDLPPQLIQQDEYVLRDRGRIVGSCRVRHYLLPSTEVIGGHIGFDIRPLERRKGYGTLILRLALEKARQLGLERVLLTVQGSNLASIRVMEKNGGVLQDALESPLTGETIRRYWFSP